MKYVYLDTSAISESHRHGISAKILREILNSKNLLPVIGQTPYFEITHNLLTHNPSRALSLFSFILDLNPEYCYSRKNLYDFELQSLIYNSKVTYLMHGHMVKRKVILQLNYMHIVTINLLMKI